MVDPLNAFQGLLDGGAAANITIDEGAFPLYGRQVLAAACKVVQHDDVVALLMEGEDQIGTNKPGAACNKDFHKHIMPGKLLKPTSRMAAAQTKLHYRGRSNGSQRCLHAGI